ncbi:MAG: transcription initiation factor IIB [Nitrososphaerota archaeon]|nr:transcription initiation factor IIB [Nitrososphaerota archaeon]MDG7023137.1 transcription initiation factor IIB [Nitrososphaerota archaeon]
MEELQYSDARCPECGAHSLASDASTGELVCRNCGFVVGERLIAEGPEWRPFSEGDKVRSGALISITKRDMGLATVVGKSNRDASGRAFAPTMRSAIERLRKWDSRAPALGSAEKDLGVAMVELERMGDKLVVSRAVKERAAYIYRKALGRGLLRGRSIRGIAAASLYAAFRDTETPRTIKDIAAVSDLAGKDIGRDYRMLLREMDLSMPVADAARNVTRVASKVGLSEKVVRKALEIIKMTEEMEISAGKMPMGLAASSLYLAGVLEGEKRTQKEIAEAAEVTEVTVRNRYKWLSEVVGPRLGSP